MNKKLIAYTFLPILGLALLGTGVASAHGIGFLRAGATTDEIATHHETMFKVQADLLGTSEADVKQAWAEGKSLIELAEAKGITKEQLAEKMKAARVVQMKTQMQALVTKGVITQAQADKRLEVMQNASAQMGKGGGGRMGMKGMF